MVLLSPRGKTHLGRAGSVKASRRRLLLKIDRWPLMLATLTTRPALLLRDNSGESGSGGGSGSGIQGLTTTKQKTAPHFPPRPTNERGGGLPQQQQEQQQQQQWQRQRQPGVKEINRKRMHTLPISERKNKPAGGWLQQKQQHEVRGGDSRQGFFLLNTPRPQIKAKRDQRGEIHRSGSGSQGFYDKIKQRHTPLRDQNKKQTSGGGFSTPAAAAARDSRGKKQIIDATIPVQTILNNKPAMWGFKYTLRI